MLNAARVAAAGLLLAASACAIAATSAAAQVSPPGEAAADTLPRRAVPDSATIASAYLDPAARELVRLARERRRLVDRSIRAYQTIARERISVGLRALRRDRTLWEREVASRIDWERDGPVRMEVLTAREVVPPVVAGVQVPTDVRQFVPHLAFDPADPFLITGWGQGDDTIVHPLAPGSEADYRFRTGGTTVIRVPSGTEVRLRELEVLPRRDEGRLVRGSLWIEAESHAVVQATFRLSSELRPTEDEDDVPALIEPAISFDYIAMEYALWESKWWLPRLLAARGAVQLGRVATLPVTYERTYGDFEVGVDPTPERVPLAGSEFAEDQRVRCPFGVWIGLQSEDDEPPEPVGEPDEEDTEEEELSDAERRECERFSVELADTATLLAGNAVDREETDLGESLLSDSELEAIRERVEALAPVPWDAATPRLSAPWQAPGLIRYNRVEGLSLGARAAMDFGPVEASATARLGMADLEPRGELAVASGGPGGRLRAAAYRRLVPMDPSTRPFTLASSLGTFLLGRDEGDYFRTLGVELTGGPSLSSPRWYDWRLYAQRERPAEKETELSLAHLLDEDHLFAPNALAHEADQLGGAVGLHGQWGEEAVGLRTRADVAVDGAVGTFDYARPSLTLGVGFPLPGPLIGLVEGGAGTSFGHPALQHLWRVGGTGTLRGYAPGVRVGETFWRGRGEISTEVPVARVGLFSDIAWAGPTEELGEGRPLLSAGVGVSVLDGLVRLDLARALRSPTGWRLTAYVDAWQ